MLHHPTPLNSAQLAIWIHEARTAEPTLYIEHICFELRGPLDQDRLKSALRVSLDAHPTLGAQIAWGPSGLLVVAGRFTVEVVFLAAPRPDLTSVLTAESLAGVCREGPLCRCLVIEVTPSHHILLFVWHHLAMDGQGIRVLLRDLASAWSGLPVCSEATIYPADENVLDQGDSSARQRAAVIAERLADLDPQPLPRRHGCLNESLSVPVDEPTLGLAVAAKALRVTVPMLLNAAYQSAIGDVLNLGKFLLGCVTAGQISVEAGDTVGCFINTVLQRADSNPVDLLRRSSREFARALGDRDVPAGDVATQLLAGLHPRPNSFPQLYLSVDELVVLALDGLDCRRLWIPHAQAKFDVTLCLEYSADRVTGALHYRAAILTPDTAQQLAAAFLLRLQEIAESGR